MLTTTGSGPAHDSSVVMLLMMLMRSGVLEARASGCQAALVGLLLSLAVLPSGVELHRLQMPSLGLGGANLTVKWTTSPAHWSLIDREKDFIRSASLPRRPEDHGNGDDEDKQRFINKSDQMQGQLSGEETDIVMEDPRDPYSGDPRYQNRTGKNLE
ncbi:unnamed protein product [Protopolystoma xenopodis]|uniref:Uncharacterized protein n=1 Tax=Protopolystoma xenopodis TaxID=117903 RepID=A0A448WRD6_9PLAT|nr:unnamed protein product [Protopolystoma xenopodis]